MKARELQIGDWVQNPLGARGWVKNIRLIPKDEEDGFGGYYLVDISYSKDGKSYATLKAKDIHPIDVTDEMMELNGFSRRGKGHWWLRMYGDKKVSVNLHEFNGQFYAFDYWIEQPFGDNTQTMFCTVWIDHAQDMMIVKKPVRHMDAGDAHGLHLLQHAMTAAGIEHEWVFKKEG